MSVLISSTSFKSTNIVQLDNNQFDVYQFNPNFENFGDYMYAKKCKLKDQVHKNVILKSQIFNGISIYVNGYTEPPALTLRNLIVENGGEYHHYYSYGKTTYVVANCISIQKWHVLRNNEKIIRPAWIVACVDSGVLLPEQNFLLKMPNNLILPPAIMRSGKPAENTLNVAEFYQRSRLHLISTLAQDMKKFVLELRRNRTQFPSKKRLVHLSQSNNFEKNSFTNFICHIDMDCFFVAVALRSRPDLIGKPVAITHSKNNKFQQNNSYSEIASCSYEARVYNVKSGMTVKQALILCPDLICLPYQFDDYVEISKLLYSAVANYTVEIIAVSCDELYVNLTDLCVEMNIRDVLAVVSEIRKEIFEVTQCNASAGIGSNILLARLATRNAKPNNQFWVQDSDVENFMEKVKIQDLPGIGHVMKEKLKLAYGKLLENCKQLQSIPLTQLQNLCGQKIGLKIYNACRGICKEALYDEMLNATTTRKSVSCDINFGIRLSTKEKFCDFLKDISEQLSLKLSLLNLKGSLLCLKLMIRAPDAPLEPKKFGGHGECNSISRSYSLAEPTSLSNIIHCTAIKLGNELNPIISDIRGIGLQMTRLIDVNGSFNNNNNTSIDQNQPNIYNFFNKRKTPSPPVDLSIAKNVEKNLQNDQSNTLSKYSTLLQQRAQLSNLKLKKDLKKNKRNETTNLVKFTERRNMGNLPEKTSKINQKVLFKPCFIDGLLIIDNMKISCYNEASEDIVENLKLFFVNLIKESEFSHIKLIVKFMERNLFGNKNINKDWFIVYNELKIFINNISKNNYGFLIF